MTKLNDNTEKGDTYRPNDKRKKEKGLPDESIFRPNLVVICCSLFAGSSSFELCRSWTLGGFPVVLLSELAWCWVCCLLVDLGVSGGGLAIVFWVVVRWQWRGQGIVRVLGVCLVVKEVGKERSFEWFSSGFEENEGEVLGDFSDGVLVGGVM
ncbi:hypothetical protein KY284_013245 [Solanum tuberosum]|nr:hypothetical protein KY284_013245 [Solanum tuberosum]